MPQRRSADVADSALWDGSRSPPCFDDNGLFFTDTIQWRRAMGAGHVGITPNLDESVVFGAYMQGLVGMLELSRGQQRKAAHKISPWRMFVLPASRGQGVGMQLLDTAIRYARSLDGVGAGI